MGLSYSKYSDSHMEHTISMASFHCSRVCSRSTLNAICSMGVDRPVPHSTLPPDRMSAVATFSATLAGWVNPNGMRTTPKPRRMCSVIWDRAPMRTSGAGEWERPSRKWCSTHHTVLNAISSARRICSRASR